MPEPEETKTCKVIYEIEVKWKDEESEEIALAAGKIICCKCDDDNGNGDDEVIPEVVPE